MKLATKPLSEFAKFSQGIQVPIQHQSLEYSDDKVRFIRIVDITSGGNEQPRYVVNPGEKFIVAETDLFMIRYGSPQVAKGWNGAIANNLFRINPINEEIDNNWLYYYLRQDWVNQYLMGISVSATMPAISFKAFGALKIHHPPLPTQRKIASILSAYDDLIENNLKRIKLLEEKAFASYKLIVQNEKLEEFTIEELANVVMGQSPTSDTYTNEKEDNLPFHQGVTNFSKYFVEHKIYCKAPIKIAEEGDILFSVRAPVGRINFTSDKICIGRGLCAFRSKKGFQNYFYHQLKEFFFAEDVIGNGAIFNAVTKVELMKVKLKTPSEKIQQEFEVEAEQMYNLILNLTKQNTKLREARDILLPKLMNGQIEV